MNFVAAMSKLGQALRDHWVNSQDSKPTFKQPPVWPRKPVVLTTTTIQADEQLEIIDDGYQKNCETYGVRFATFCFTFHCLCTAAWNCLDIVLSIAERVKKKLR